MHVQKSAIDMGKIFNLYTLDLTYLYIAYAMFIYCDLEGHFPKEGWYFIYDTFKFSNAWDDILIFSTPALYGEFVVLGITTCCNYKCQRHDFYSYKVLAEYNKIMYWAVNNSADTFETLNLQPMQCYIRIYRVLGFT